MDRNWYVRPLLLVGDGSTCSFPHPSPLPEGEGEERHTSGSRPTHQAIPPYHATRQPGLEAAESGFATFSSPGCTP